MLPPASSPLVFLGDEGLALRGSPLRIDPRRPASLAFISGARYPARRLAGHRRVIASAVTLGLLGAPARRALPAPFGRPFELARLTLSLRPSGHLPGAAQLLVLTASGQEVCFAGPWRGGGLRLVDDGELVTCDELVLDATWARPGLRFPSRDSALAGALEAVRAALTAGQTPVLLADPFGAAQELLVALAGTPIRAHRAVRTLAAAFRRLGLHEAAPRALTSRPQPGEVLILPPGARAPDDLSRPFVLHLTPLAARRGGAGVLGDVGIAYSDHPDARELLRYAEASGARHIHLQGEGAGDAVRSLRRKGLPALVLREGEQLALL